MARRGHRALRVQGLPVFHVSAVKVEVMLTADQTVDKICEDYSVPAVPKSAGISVILRAFLVRQGQNKTAKISTLWSAVSITYRVPLVQVFSHAPAQNP